MSDKPIWTVGDEAMRWLNEAEQAQGGANGPTIKLRAALASLVRIVPTGKMPDLPEPDHSLDGGTTPFYTARQMRDYALSALFKEGVFKCDACEDSGLMFGAPCGDDCGMKNTACVSGNDGAQ